MSTQSPMCINTQSRLVPHLILILTYLLSVTSPAIPGSCLMSVAVAATSPSPLPSLLAAEATIGGVVIETVDLVVTAILL